MKEIHYMRFFLFKKSNNGKEIFGREKTIKEMEVFF